MFGDFGGQPVMYPVQGGFPYGVQYVQEPMYIMQQPQVMVQAPQQQTQDPTQYIQMLSQYNQAVDDPNFDPSGWKKYYPADDKFFNFDYGSTYQDQVQILHPDNPSAMEVYQGELNTMGQRHGFGVLHTADAIRRGEFRNGNFTGWGREARANNEVVEGRFEDGYLYGKGCYQNHKGNKYIGDFVDGVRSGYGDLTTNKFHYAGEFRDGKLNGRGRIEFFKEGHVYEGDFRDNEINGNGVFQWNNKDIYEGQMANGRMHGQGRYTHANGQVYEGSYENGVKNGMGRLTYPDGKVYEGQFTNGLPHGTGVMTTNGMQQQVTFDMGRVV